MFDIIILVNDQTTIKRLIREMTKFIVVLSLIFSCISLVSPSISLAANCGDGTALPANPGRGFNPNDYCRDKGGYEAGTSTSSTSYNPTVNDNDGKKLVGWIDTITTTLSAITGLAVTISIIFAGIQYSTAGGNPQAAAAAKKRIGQAVTALVATALMYFFLQWIVVGGIF